MTTFVMGRALGVLVCTHCHAAVRAIRPSPALCPRCGEGVNFGRVTLVGGQRLCLTCAHPELRYWKPVAPEE